MVGNEVLIKIGFILLVAILTALAVYCLLFILLWIHSKCSYKKMMKPLNEAVERQRKEAAERRKRMFSS
jgi:uncharacterized protein YpmS